MPRYHERPKFSHEHRVRLSKAHLRAKLRRLGSCHPLVRELYNAMLQRNDMALIDISVVSGIGPQAISRWTHRSPLLTSFEAVAHTLGYELQLKEFRK